MYKRGYVINCDGDSNRSHPQGYRHIVSHVLRMADDDGDGRYTRITYMESSKHSLERSESRIAKHKYSVLRVLANCAVLARNKTINDPSLNCCISTTYGTWCNAARHVYVRRDHPRHSV